MFQDCEEYKVIFKVLQGKIIHTCQYIALESNLLLPKYEYRTSSIKQPDGYTSY
jgi:hypothetical protein